MEKKQKVIALCASISFYKDVIDVKNELVEKGYSVLLPDLSIVMEKENNYNREYFLKKFYSKEPVLVRSRAIREHFKKIEKSDVILVINQKKNGVDGYIGGNVLMEMGVAFFLGKKIFILNPVSESQPFAEEIFGMYPTVLFGDVSKLPHYKI